MVKLTHFWLILCAPGRQGESGTGKDEFPYVVSRILYFWLEMTSIMFDLILFLRALSNA